MKKYLIILIIILNSCQTNKEKKSIPSDFKNFKEEIIGIWVVESVIRYENGVEKELEWDETYSLDFNNDGNVTEYYLNDDIMGTTKNPKYYKFTKHNELYIYDKEKNYEYSFKYYIKENQINSIYIKNNSSERYKIIYLDSDELIIEDEAECNNCSENELINSIIYTIKLEKI
jgi:hypothetical protein